MASLDGWRALLPVVLLLTAIESGNCAAQAQSVCCTESGALTGSITIDACPTVVFEAIKRSRYQEPERRKVVEKSGNRVVLEESFATIPIIGSAVCRYEEVEVPNKRIDYSIIASRQFKQFEGAWELQPINGGAATRLKLTSKIDTYVAVPFKKQITHAGCRKDIRRRLNNIKRYVESNDRTRVSLRSQAAQ
ncbi:MAG: SRPBCC family protein [Candidatus Obscuribacterales bacterium]|nr:SRPBCC family protein [Candidatus Obscuribacterales bacterium]